MQLICGFVLAYAKSRFSHDKAHLLLNTLFHVFRCEDLKLCLQKMQIGTANSVDSI